MTRWLSCTLAVVALAGLPSAGGDGAARATRSPGSFSGVYQLHLGGILGGEISLEVRLAEGTYRADAFGQTAGVVGAVWSAGFSALVEGERTGRRYRPERFVVDAKSGGKPQYVAMLFDPATGAPREVEAEPPFDPKPWQIDPRAQTGAFDPLSAVLSGLALLPKAALCNRTIEVFDGRKRYALDMGLAQADPEGLRCKAEYRRVAGFKPKQMAKPNWPLTLWFAKGEAGLWHVIRAQGDTPLGVASVHLRAE